MCEIYIVSQYTPTVCFAPVSKKDQSICFDVSNIHTSPLGFDTEKNPVPNASFCDKLSRHYWKLNSNSAHNFIKISLLCAYILSHNFDILHLSET